MTKTLFILRGLPGCGKSTYATQRWEGLTPMKVAPAGWSPVSVSADHFFMAPNGTYRWDKTKLGQAHAQAMTWLIRALQSGCETVVVDNVHKEHWEYQVARELGVAFGYVVSVIDLYDGGCTDEELSERQSTTHQVPLDKITKVRAEWQKG